MRRAASWFGIGLLAVAFVAGGACTGDLGSEGEGEQGKQDKDREEEETDKTPEDIGPSELDARVVDYNEALRTAVLKLSDVTPTLQQIRRVQDAEDQKMEYELIVDELFDSPAFSRRMVRFWRDTFKQGGADLDTAPVFAAQVMVEGRPFSDVFTAQTGNCPTYDADTDTFVPADCANGAPVQAGVLTNPGTMRQFYGNMAFRRVRWVQEVFACSQFPAEYATNNIEMGAGQYTSPWTFETISNAPIDFRDTSAVICANCHTTMNHLAPLFGNFDQDGMWQNNIAVMTPTAPDPVATELSHWLVDGETTAWRLNQPVADLAELGQAMAADPAVSQCVIARAWNFAMSKDDIVGGLATVPAEVINPHVQDFLNGGQDLKATLKAIMKSEDFVSF